MIGYTLAVGDAEIRRYLLMAERAEANEEGLWSRAGIVAGAMVADIGCGPAAVSVILARRVAPGGHVVAVEREEAALAAAGQMVERAAVTNVELRRGDAAATGIAPASMDVVMMRHVLAHNQRDEQRIVDHLATLVRPGGCVYLVDSDATAIRYLGIDPDLPDLMEKYRELHRRRGNDLQTGLRLGQLLTHAGLEPVTHEGRYEVLSAPPGLRPPPWAARETMVADGVASEADVSRWEAAFARMDAAELRPTMFIPSFVAIGRAV